ncbi:MAG: choice-of-anchor D domain-containing protein [Deltaproteobacteria bacterium]|nr:choice-of-anchor D domain-containing protein [Deltaproteobacteria bacterium]
MTRRLLALCALVSLAGCGDGGTDDTFVLVELRGTISNPRTIDIDLMFNGQMASRRLDSGAAIQLPKTALFRVLHGSGPMMVTARANDPNGVTYASAMATGDVVEKSTTSIVVDFGGGGDGGLGTLAIDRSSHDFGMVLLNSASAEAVFNVTNRGTVATSALTVTLTGAGGLAVSNNDCNGKTLAASATCQVGVTFTPTANGQVMGAISVAAQDGSVMATLRGEGITPGALLISPLMQDFGAVTLGGNSGTQTFTVTNTGQQPAGAISTALGGSDAAQFTVTADGCMGQALGANATCQITVRFSPSSAGAKTASLTATASPGGTAIAQLAGQGLSIGNITITPTSRDFGSVQEGLTGTTQVFMLQNTGQSATGGLVTAVTGANAADFSVGSDGCAGVTLAASDTCMVSIGFSPATAGSKIATLTVTGSPGGAAAAPLSGTALASARLALNPTTNDFNSVVTGSSVTATFTVTNSGGVSSGVPGVAITGADAAQFSVMSSSCSAALGAGGSCSIVVRFAPTTTGAKSASLAVNATPGGVTTALLGGTGVAPGALSISPTSQSFAAILQGTQSAPINFTVTNTGGAATSALATRVLPTGAEFRIVTDGCNGMTLAPAGTCVVGVRFEPTSAGPKSATLEVSGTVGGLAPASLSGTGLGPALLVMSPTTFSFPSTVVGGTSQPQNFTISNTGGVAAGTTTPLMTALGGAGMADFDILGNTCSGTLAPGATCNVSVAFNPGSAGNKSASLTVSAGPGGSAAASLDGAGQTPAVLTLAPAAGSMLSFGSVPISGSLTQTYVVGNSGQQGSSAITVTLTGTDFALLTGLGSDCASGTTVLAGGATCNVRVQFSPTAAATRNGTLSAAATVGGAPSPLTLTGTGQAGAALSGSPATLAFGLVEVGVSSSSLVWTISNTGDVATTGTLTLSNSNPTEVTATSTCGATLAPAATCVVNVTLKPAGGGARSATLSMAAMGGNGGTATVAVSGTGGYRLTVVKPGSGTGTVTSTPGSISCGTTCFDVFAPGTVVLVRARTTNGSNSFLSSMTGPGCVSPERDCSVTVTATSTVTATFSPMTNNLIFVSDRTFATDLGVAGYDSECNRAASSLGINDNAGTGYIAWVGSSTSAPGTRLGATARGWVRMDGEPFADAQTDLVTSNQVYNPITFDGLGERVAPEETAMTGVDPDGAVNTTQNCGDFRSTTGNLLSGMVGGGPFNWTAGSGSACTPSRIICMGKTKTTALPTPRGRGKMIWMTSKNFVIGGGVTPDDACNSALPSGVSRAVALIAYTGTAAADQLDRAQTYVRPDGVIVGTGDDIMRMTHESGIWQSNDGVYRQIGFGRIWTGAKSPTTRGTINTTCDNWRSDRQEGYQGFHGMIGRTFFDGTQLTCSIGRLTEAGLYCLEP